MGAKDKADLLARTFQNKCVLKEAATNDYTEVDISTGRCMVAPTAVTVKMAEQELTKLDVDSATGPDQLPARILKECAKQLAKPICKLANLIVKHGHWPECWIEHWIVPLYKRLSPADPLNYRGVHLTTVLSKIAKKVIGTPIADFLEKSGV